MSVYSIECTRLNGDIMAYVRVQNDWTGAILGQVKKIFLDGDNYYCHADGNRVIVNEQRQRFLDYESRVRTALDWYNKTKF